MRKFTKFLIAILAVFICQIAIQAQTSGSIIGTITDPKGDVVPGASVHVKSPSTGEERNATANEKGVFTINQLTPGLYTVTIENAGFKKAVATDVKVDVSGQATLAIALEIGTVGETVTVTSAQEVINTTSPTLTNVINTRQVVDLPLAGRNPVDLAALQAGIAVVGDNTRGAAVGGLRQTSVNLTQDGINAMDNFVKTSSFFALTSPSLNAIGEFSITTGTTGSDAGRGAAQVNMVTKAGSNTYHGGGFLQLINESYNANTFFNNYNGTAKAILRQHYYGFDIGGPVHFLNFGEGVPKHWSGKDKAFFFFSYEAFRQNRAATRNRTVLSANARQGIFQYNRVCGTDITCTPGVQTVNLLTTSTRGFGINPVTTAVIGRTPLPNNSSCGAADGFNFLCYEFNVAEATTNDKYVVRYDHQLVKDTAIGSHKIEFVYSRVVTGTHPDVFTNAVEAPFPGGVNAFQSSVRSLMTPALVSTFGSSITNTLRYGRQWAPVIFDRDTPASEPFVVLVTATSPDNRNLAQPRNTIVNQITDNLTWAKGNHLWKFGTDIQNVLGISQNDAGIIQTITLGGANGANGPGFVQANLPFSSTVNLTNATAIYANVVGLLSSASQVYNVQNATSGFVPGYTRLRKVQEQDLALFAQDQWRLRSNFTLSYGVRWEFLGVPTVPNGLAIQPKYSDLYGVSGFGNLFKPTAAAGPAAGVATQQFVSGSTGIGLYKNDWNNFAPFIGIAYSPNFKSGPLHFLFGETGKSSLRAGYSVSYLHDGVTTFTNALGTGTTNPGLIQTANLSQLSCPASNPTCIHSGTLLGTLSASGVPLDTPTYKIPITDRDNILANTGNGLWAIDPNIRIPYVHQYSAGFEREIFKDTALEIRYVGNQSTNQWRAIDFNEVNIFENGFLGEFLNAQKNLTARGGLSFAPNSVASPCAACVALPILDKFFGVGFAGVNPIVASSAYSSSAFISNLNGNNIGTMAFSLANSATYRPTRESTIIGLPANFFLANPNANFAVGLSNGGKSWYNAMEVELRRRFANGLQFQADYTWSKAILLGDGTGNNQSDFTQPLTIRNLQLDKRRSSQDQTQRFVANAVYELPFGKGKAFFSGANGVLDRIVGGWTTGGIVTWSTGVPFYITAGRTTLTAYAAAGAQLSGISYEAFKGNLGVYKDSRGVFFVNPNLLDITVDAKGKTTQSRLKAGLLTAPAPGTLGNFPVNSLSGPQYFNLDLSITKRIRITENVRFELKTTAINVLNHSNFVYGGSNFDSTTFGVINSSRNGNRGVNFIGQVRF